MQGQIFAEAKEFEVGSLLLQEKKIKAMKTQCESMSECQSLYGLDLIRCARRCMSAECYDELYAHDEVTVHAGDGLNVATALLL